MYFLTIWFHKIWASFKKNVCVIFSVMEEVPLNHKVRFFLFRIPSLVGALTKPSAVVVSFFFSWFLPGCLWEFSTAPCLLVVFSRCLISHFLMIRRHLLFWSYCGSTHTENRIIALMWEANFADLNRKFWMSGFKTWSFGWRQMHRILNRVLFCLERIILLAEDLGWRIQFGNFQMTSIITNFWGC